jgi:hypothetical protein
MNDALSEQCTEKQRAACERLSVARFQNEVKRSASWNGLVAPAATAAAATTVSAATTATASTTAAAVAAAATPTTATAAESAATTTAAAAARAIFLGLGFVHGEGSAAMFLAVEGRDRCLSFIFTAHFDEPEPLASAGVPISDDLSAFDSSMRSKQLFESRAIDIVAQIPDIQLLAHFYLLL